VKDLYIRRYAMAKLCCFLCPTRDYAEKNLEDQCPKCGNPYGFPLTSAPEFINDYRVLRPLSRGFYAATYVAERSGMLKRRVVLKVVSKQVYEFFGKDFEQECRDHARIADGSEHVVQIDEGHKDVEVTFGGIKLRAHVAVLRFVDGEAFGELLKQPDRLGAKSVAQIGIDLFRMLEELKGKVAFHNDLHGANIMIEKVVNRPEAIDATIRAVAIDLGSASDASKSDAEQRRLGDIHWVASHLLAMVDHLLRDSDKTSDLDYRLASALEEIAHRLTPSATNYRLPGMAELLEEIRGAYQHVSAPWSEPFKLRKFNDSYNAQTLAASLISVRGRRQMARSVALSAILSGCAARRQPSPTKSPTPYRGE
jgi:serine/threonine protein kinase